MISFVCGFYMCTLGLVLFQISGLDAKIRLLRPKVAIIMRLMGR